MDIQRHIQELKRMRQVCREEGITNRSLAEHFDCTEQSVFEILEGVTKESELRNRVYTLLTTKELLAPFLGDDETGQAASQIADAGLPDLFHAFHKLGMKPGEYGKLFNRSGPAVYFVVMGRSTKGALYDAIRANLIDGRPPVLLPDEPKKVPRATPPTPMTPAVYEPPAAKPVAPVVMQLVQNDDPDEVLRAQIMALEELTEATKDLLVAREAQRRYGAAVAIARRVGLNVNSHERQTAAA